MTQSNLSATTAEIKAYKKLPIKDRFAIVAAINSLRDMDIFGNLPSPETIIAVCQKTGHLEIAMACYGAELNKQDWI